MDTPLATELDLSAEFAYRFQFRMLQKCLRFEECTLNTSSSAGTHGRVAALQGLSSGDGYMKLPRLYYFRIVGAWHMEDEVPRALFHEVASSIQNLDMNCCTGFNLEGWMEASSGLRQMEVSYCSLDVTEQQLTDLGQVPFDELPT
ncbi:hypothetical protein BGZ51_003764 [Haplosporangium sp. Z 767]|nr:hypothetical protein BGZ51_003764 [Haplosporangium sp. Z 767]KAF9184309.1 hypothetical protein BGZ50_003781 [Haplosporangium sp. Z 11]